MSRISCVFRVLRVRIPWDIHIVTFGPNVCVPSLPALQKANQKTADTISRSLTNAWGRDPNSVLHVRIPRDIHIVTFGLNVCVPSLPARRNEKKTKQARFRQT